MGVIKVLKECQPFKDGAASLICVGCFKMLMFPSGARRVRCGYCSIITDGITVKCTSCKEKLKANLGSSMICCTKCGYKFKPMARLKVRVPEEKQVEEVLVPLEITINYDTSVHLTADEKGKEPSRTLIAKLLPHQPFQLSADMWAENLGVGSQGVSYFRGDVRLNPARTPREMDLADGDVITVKKIATASSTGHQLVVAQFGGPTNCAYCKEFIWGIYHQGKRCAKCSIPVHHKCASKLNTTCEADLRQMFGIVNFNDDDDEEGLDEPVLGVVIDEEDKIDFAANVQEAVEPECDPNFMKPFDKLSGFTDEEIQQLWLQYDKDESGVLERDEMRSFLVDMLSVGGGDAKRSDPATEEAVDRFILVIDSNNDGVVQWEEFWQFLKAQQEHNFLEQFKGTTLSTEQLYELWYKYDADGSGTLEAEELLQLFGDICGLRGDTASRFAQGTLGTFLRPGAAVSWDEFCNTIVPVITSAL